METEIIPRVLVAVSGSVATIKIEEIVSGLIKFAEVKVITTKAAQHFFQVDKIKAYGKDSVLLVSFALSDRLGVPVYTDEDEYAAWKGRGDPVLHIVYVAFMTELTRISHPG
jgi:phosphopantothenoylcysteine decarboxylase